MASLLDLAGYGPVESLHQFLSRFTRSGILTELDEDLQTIWIAHKNVESILKLQTTLNGNNFHDHNHKNNIVPKRNLRTSRNDKFSFSNILDKLVKNLHCCIADYAITECLILYNWGINSFELVLPNDEFFCKISALQTKKRNYCNHRDYFKKWKYILSNFIRRNSIHTNEKQLRPNNFDLFEEEEKRVIRLRGKRRSQNLHKLRIIYEQRNRSSRDLYRRKEDPLQEIFNKDKILYDLQRRRWPGNNFLNATSVDNFMRSIFGDGTHLPESSPGWRSLRLILSRLLKTHKAILKFDGYARILKHHLKKSDFGLDSVKDDLKPVPNRIISSFITDIVRKVLDVEFFGANRPKKNFLSEVARIINGSKNENFILEPLVKSVFGSTWFRELGPRVRSEFVAFRFVKWLVLDYIFIILRHSFYITEVGSSGYQLYYYRKCDIDRAIDRWIKRQILKKNICLVEGKLSEWDSAERKWLETGLIELSQRTVKMPKSTEYIEPIANVRFMPKTPSNGELRMITSFAVKKTILRSSDNERRELYRIFVDRRVARLVNLRRVKFLLQFLIEKYGSGIKPVPNNPKIALAWSRVLSLKKAFGKLYHVKADISDAFGSISPTLLSKIIDDKLKCVKNGCLQLKRIKECRARRGSVELNSRRSFSDRPRENWMLLSRSEMVGEKKKLPSYKTADLKSVLDQMILHQYLKINGKCYRLMNGLSQGSAGRLSPLLCEIYYSEMDRTYFGEFMSCSECVLLRGVDDYLLITADEERARQFLAIVSRGIEEYNVTFSARKLQTNLNGGEHLVSYLGLTFDVENGNVKPDYSKYESKDILSTMRLSDQLGLMFFWRLQFLMNKTLGIIPLKLYPVTLGQHNNPSAVREVIFGGCLLQSNRVFSLTRRLYRGGENYNLDVCVVLSRSLSKIATAVTCVNASVSRDEIVWLFWTAALIVFRRYSGSFPDVIVVVRHRIYVVERRLQRHESLLKELKRGVESWRELRQIFKVIGTRSKPSNRKRERRRPISVC